MRTIKIVIIRMVNILEIVKIKLILLKIMKNLIIMKMIYYHAQMIHKNYEEEISENVNERNNIKHEEFYGEGTDSTRHADSTSHDAVGTGDEREVLDNNPDVSE
jgi:hypothetical protein